MFRKPLVFLMTLVCGLHLAALVSAHDLKDGVVERAVQIKIRGRKAILEYSFGLSEGTMKEMVTGWSPADGPIDGSGGNLNEQPRQDREGVAESSNDVDKLSSVVEDLAIRKRFQDHVMERISGQLELKLDGTLVSLRSVDIEPYPRHHFDFTGRFEFDLPEKKAIYLTLRDTNFMELEGGVRYATRATDGSMVARSNVAPIIVRAKRHDLSLLNPDQRQNVCKIDATIAWSGKVAKD